MHPVQFFRHAVGRYEAPSRLEEVLDLLARHRERARIVAGGTDLLVELDRRIGPAPEVVIDLSCLADLARFHETPYGIHLGPLVTHNQLATSEQVRARAPVLAQACAEVGSPALRNRATIVGNVVTASPANDTISALRALGATVHLASATGRRDVPIAEFHTGVRSTVMAPDELVAGITVQPMSADERGVFLKLGLRRAQAISVVHLAVVCGFEGGDPAGSVTSARLAVGSVAPTVVELERSSAAIVGAPLDAVRIRAAAAAARDSVAPIDDLRATAVYRSELVEVMVSRALSALRRDEAALSPVPPVLGGPQLAGDSRPRSFGPGDQMSATVNGESRTAPWTDATLLDWLREGVGLTGTKEGCAEGECGACTVHLDGVAVLACLVPAGRAGGAEVTTVEGLAGPDRLSALQDAFVAEGAVQCGYCIPGFLMAGDALVEECSGDSPRDDLDERLRDGLSGNLCRCTGYYKILDAVRATITGSDSSVGAPAAEMAEELGR